MKVKGFTIKNFRSINNLEEISVEPKITTLIGKNESGKTNILKALESLNKDYKYEKTDLCIYSPAYKKLDSGSIENSDIPIVTIYFLVEKEDKDILKSIHPKLSKAKNISVTKYFDNTYEVEVEEVDLEELEKEKIEKEIENVMREMKEQAKVFGDKLNAHTQRYAQFTPSKPTYEQILSEIESYDMVNDDEKISADFNSFYSALRGLPGQDPTIKNDIESFIKLLESSKSKILNMLQGENSFIPKAILEILPNFLYFKTGEELEDKILIAEFKSKRKEHRTLNNLAKLAHLNIDKLDTLSSEEREITESDITATIKGLINESWKQEEITVKLRLEPTELSVFVKDDTGAAVPPSRRSEGFRWFLSFYINFTAEAGNELKNTVILLDDPGVYLHPSGQKDLLRTLETIAERNQIIFTTHSPFLIDRSKLNRIRIVSKEKDGVCPKFCVFRNSPEK
jgi:predicted ATP-dependent endonuclease of OLD family